MKGRRRDKEDGPAASAAMKGMRRDREDGPVASVARSPTPIKCIKIADQALTYLREKSERETELKHEELALGREELALRREELAM